jgi:hypothetical protein
MATDTSKITGAADELSAGLAKGGTAAKTLGAEIANAIKSLDGRVAALESGGVTPPNPNPEPNPPPAGEIPLTWDDPMFANARTGINGWPNGTGWTIENASFTSSGKDAMVGGQGSFNLDVVRMNGREGIRVSGPGTMNINRTYVETTGTQDDHADGLQAYKPGASGTINITNSTFRSHDTHATAGVWVSDNYGATLNLTNVVFHGGPYGLRCKTVNGNLPISVACKDVFFVGPFAYGEVLFEATTAPITITKWENVRHATIVNGQLVPGEPMSKPPIH